MALNKCMNGSQIILNQGEMVLRDEKDVTVTFKKFSHSTEHMKGTKVGRVYLTNYRLIFKNNKSNDMLQELSVPFPKIKDFEIKQPVFGANYLQGKIMAEPNGGWEGSCLFEMTFKSGGAIEIGQQLVKLATNPPQAIYPVQTTTVIYAGAPQGYEVPGTSNAYFFPAQDPTAPPGYPANAPPPMYPAAAGPSAPPAYPQQSGFGHMNAGERQKAMEAAQTTLPPSYDPTQAPPKYDDVTKKSQ